MAGAYPVPARAGPSQALRNSECAAANPLMVSVTLCGHRVLLSGNLGTISNVPASPVDVSISTKPSGSNVEPTSKRASEAATLPDAAMTRSNLQPLALAVSGGGVASVGSDGP